MVTHQLLTFAAGYKVVGRVTGRQSVGGKGRWLSSMNVTNYASGARVCVCSCLFDHFLLFAM